MNPKTFPRFLASGLVLRTRRRPRFAFRVSRFAVRVSRFAPTTAVYRSPERLQSWWGSLARSRTSTSIFRQPRYALVHCLSRALVYYLSHKSREQVARAWIYHPRRVELSPFQRCLVSQCLETFPLAVHRSDTCCSMVHIFVESSEGVMIRIPVSLYDTLLSLYA